MAASEAQVSNLLFTTEKAAYNLMLERGDIILHKKLRTAGGAPMVYVVKEVGRHTEGDRPQMVAYESLYDDQVHFRPAEMFTSDRFCILTAARYVNRALDKR